jgi:hypothetical protein
MKLTKTRIFRRSGGIVAISRNYRNINAIYESHLTGNKDELYVDHAKMPKSWKMH